MFYQKTLKRLLQFTKTGFAGAVFGLLAATSATADIAIETKPLFTTPAVIPALILAVDDSGSMDSEVLMKTNDGALWWHTGDKSFVGRNQNDAVEAGVINFNEGGVSGSTWKKYVYLFPNGTGQTSGRRAYSDSSNDHYAVPPIGDFAFARSPQYNMMYFDPAITYEPWPSLGGYTFNDADPTEAKTDPTRGSEIFDLTTDQISSESNHTFKLHSGMTLPVGTRKVSGSSCQDPLTAPEAITSTKSQGLCYFPATFYLRETTPLPENFGYLASKSAGGADVVADGKAPDDSTMIRYEIKPENFESSAAYDAAIQNFANWFTYYHKRHIATRGAIGHAFEDIYGFRIGSYKINTNPSSSLPYRDLSDVSSGGDRENFFYDIYRNFIGSGGTPNREAVNRMWSQLQRTDSGAPIQEECQMNFGVLFTDGYSNVQNTGVGNRDDELGAPFADSYSETMGDVAARLYLDNPRSDLPTEKVPVPPGCSLSSPPLDLDCNKNLHLNFFALTLGAPGTIFNVNQEQTEDPYTHHPTWPNVTVSRNPVQIDDLWHATLNSRGKLLSVDVPSELGEKFAEILADIGARLERSSTSAATSSAVLNTSTLIYTAGFNSDDWSGSFTASSIIDEQPVYPPSWDAQEELSSLGFSNRNIFTRAANDPGTGAGVTFEWGNLTVDQQMALNYNETDSEDELGSDRVAWLRGDESANASFRDREGRLLGDIVNSDPFYHAGVLYVGANDGMLHAFDGETGEELFAFIPSELLLPEPDEQFAPLSRLTNPDYLHRYFVDGSVFIRKVNFTATEKHVLVGSMGVGGRSIFALDVTDPEQFSAADVLWEFRDSDLGYGVGQPRIEQLNDGTWVAVFGNGYNSDQHRAVLYVVNLETGALIKKLDTNIGDETTPNGLANPVGTIWPAMTDKTQRMYAGDLLGNLWRFNLAEASPANWAVDRLFTAMDEDGYPQPITARPGVGKAPGIVSEGEDAVVVTFGTGSYFRTSDKTDHQIQSLYGIFDHEDLSWIRNNGSLNRNNLLMQSVIHTEVEYFGDEDWEIRVLSDHEIDEATHSGWYIDLDEDDTGKQGERVISGANVKYANGLVWAEISTLIPSFDNDVCGPVPGGYVMSIDLATGGRMASPIFDLDRSGTFDINDKVTLDDGTVVSVSGVKYGQGEEIITVGVPDEPYELLIPGDLSLEPDILRGLKSRSTGRQGWQQLR